MISLLKTNDFVCRVSSVLNKDTKSYGKQYMFDDMDDTCWNSNPGQPQWILVQFEEECNLIAFEIQFQGGFAGKVCHVEAGCDDKNASILEYFYPEDINSVQKFILKTKTRAKCFRFVFSESTDLFGRIIVYKLSMYP